MVKPEINSLSHAETKLPRLWLLTNRFMTIGQPLPRIVRHCAAAGVKMTIMSETDLAPWVALELAEKLAEATHNHGGRLLVSERADLMQLSNADGLLLNAAGLPASRIKNTFDKSRVVGLLVRTEQELHRTALEGFDFALVTNTFASDDLNSVPQRNEMDRLRRIVEESSLPVVAAGGMTPQRAPLALETGAISIAMSEVAMESLNIGLLVDAFRQALGGIE